MIKEITAAEFVDVTKEGFAIVDIYGNNCGPCVALSKTLKEIEFDFPFVNIYKLNASAPENAAFCQEHGILGVPTIFFMLNGELVKRDMGAMTSKQIMDIAGQYLY